MPILKFDPFTGKPLTNNIELVSSTPAKVTESKPVESVKTEPLPEITINPILAPNNQEDVEALVQPMNELLEYAEYELQILAKNVKTTPNLGIAGFKYEPTITRESSGAEGFKLVKPKEPLKFIGKSIIKDIIIDRVHLEPTDVKELLKKPLEAKVILLNLVLEMYANICLLKDFKADKTYVGEQTATISRPGQPGKYCSNYEDQYIEIRMYSDIAEVKDERS